MATFRLKEAAWKRCFDPLLARDSLAKRVVQLACPSPIHVEDRKAVAGELPRPILQCVLAQTHNSRVLYSVGFDITAQEHIDPVVDCMDMHEVCIAVGNEVVAILVWCRGLGFGHEMLAVGRKFSALDVPHEEGVGLWPNTHEMCESVIFRLAPSLQGRQEQDHREGCEKTKVCVVHGGLDERSVRGNRQQ